MEKSVSKFTTKFVIKFLIWFILFTVIGTIGVVMAFASSLENVGDTIEAMTSSLNALIIGLVIVDLVVAFIATKLSIKGAAKKVEVTSDNKDKIIKNIAIVLIIFTILVGILHVVIKNGIMSIVEEDSDIDVEELKEDVEEYVEEYDLSEDEEEELEAFVKFMNMTNIYVFDCVFLALMIPVAKLTIDKKVA